VSQPKLRHKVEGAGWRAAADASIAALIKAMDDASLPLSAGRDQAAKVAKEVGLRMSKERIGMAVMSRKTCPGQVVIDLG
jgi:hypothetical protein